MNRYTGGVYHRHELEEGGVISTRYYPREDLLMITRMDVRTKLRRRGLGKKLLRSTIDRAEELGVNTIKADITSREALKAAISVFGEESISIHRVGEYGAQNPGGLKNLDWEGGKAQRCSAILKYSVNEPPTSTD